MTIDARTGRRRPGPAPRVSREAIADAALALGFDRLTVTAVGERLGVSHGALYRHVTDRDDVVRAAAERLVELHPPPPAAQRWPDTLVAAALAYWELLRSTPGFVEAILASPAAREPLHVHGTALTRAMLAHGLSPETAVLAADSVLDLAQDSARTAARLDEADPERIRRRITARLSEDDDEPAREVIIGALLGDPGEWFRRKLDVVVRGLGTLV
ncbi:helix-turn-helix domain-containing protein [Pseudonocardia sp. NPDC049635]|uniref:TetR/AcrR family transcriptional regulator n=1 Tax=Pseudonocardia sp. NPDC049635 TaxID=3155506 RepID=UPI0033E872B7